MQQDYIHVPVSYLRHESLTRDYRVISTATDGTDIYRRCAVLSLRDLGM
nr:hypothetical protein [uncultured Arsenicibacter sp.]